MKMVKKALNEIKATRGFERVKFIILYGSAAGDRMHSGSDIDLCIYYDGDMGEASDFRFRLLSKLPEVFDVQIFQFLPLYVRVEVLKGKVIYCEDETFLHDIAWETIKEFEAFKHRFYDYIGEKPIE